MTTDLSHITCVGAVYIDTILTTAHYPEEDSKLRATACQVRRGGNAANSLEIITQYGPGDHPTLANPVLVSALPAASSADHAFIQQSLPDVRLESTHNGSNLLAQEAPKSWILRSAATSSRTIVNLNTLQELTYDDLERVYTAGLARSTHWWHFEGRNVDAVARFIRLVRRTQADAVVVSLEIEKPGRAGLQEIAHLCDVVFYSKSFALHAGYADLAAFLMAERARLAQHDRAVSMLYTELLFGTWGELGSGVVKMHYDDDARGEVFRCGAALPEQGVVLDTVGAGDVFIGSIIAQLAAAQASNDADKVLYSKSFLEACLREANTLCGIKVCQEGFHQVRDRFLLLNAIGGDD